MLNFKTQKYIFQIQKLVKMVNHTARVKAMVKMKMEVTKMEVKARISTTATNQMPLMVSTI